MAALVISSENDAWAALKKAVDGGFDGPRAPTEIEFKGWPTFTFKLDVGDASLSPRTMEGLLAFQESLKRTFVIAKYGESNLQRLTREERDALEYDIKVRPGSTNLSGDPKTFLKELALAAAAKMDAKHFIIIALIAAIGYFGESGWNHYLQERVEMRKVETSSSDTKEMLNTLNFVVGQNTEQQKILAKALGASRKAADIDDTADDARRALLKSIPEDATATVPGKNLVPGYVARELAKNPRNEARTVKVRGQFSILRVDTTSPDGFRVRLLNLNTKEEVTAHLRDALISEDEREVIQASEWKKKPIFAILDVTRRGGQVIEAVVSKAATKDADLDRA